MEKELLESLEKTSEKKKNPDKIGVKPAVASDISENQHRNPKNGQFVKGNCANPNGRPRTGTTIIENFRENPHSDKVIQNIYNIASTLGTDDEHPKAFECSKLITDKLIPTLMAQELNISGEDRGFIYMPEPKESEKD